MQNLSHVFNVELTSKLNTLIYFFFLISKSNYDIYLDTFLCISLSTQTQFFKKHTT